MTKRNLNILWWTCAGAVVVDGLLVMFGPLNDSDKTSLLIFAAIKAVWCIWIRNREEPLETRGPK